MAELRMLLFFLLLLVSYSVCDPRRSLLSNLLPPESNPTSDLTNDCVCYHITGPTVPDVLQTELERVVVYLYKDANNNLKVYTPNKEKQLLLPDFGVDKDDMFVNLGQDSSHFILFNPALAVPSNRSGNVGPSHSNIQPEIQSNVDTVQTVLSDLNDYQPGQPGWVDPEADTDTIDVTDNLDLPPASSDFDVKLPPLDFDDGLPTNPPVLDKDTLLDTIQNGFHKPSVAEDKYQLKDDKLLDEQKHSLYQLGSSQITELFDNKDLQGLTDDGSKGDIQVGSSKLSHSGLRIPSNGESLTDSLNEDEKFVLNHLEPLNDLYSKVYKYVTFDVWFDQQMKKIENVRQSPNKNFDLTSLKRYIEKILYESGMYVTKDGVLIDSNGKALNVANLMLRPILIGASVAYDTVFAQPGGDKYELPSNLPYLEAILVTLVNPPRILGVIPLGKTYVPRASYRRSFNYRDLQTNNAKLECKTGKCTRVVYYGVNHNKVLSSPRQTVRSGAANIVNQKPSLFSKNKLKFSPSQRRKENKNGNTKLRLNFDWNEFLKALSFFNNVKEDRKASPVDDGSEYADLFEETWVEEPVDGSNPVFRIIGGNAATSSGTPVSSKGRSGIHYR